MSKTVRKMGLAESVRIQGGKQDCSRLAGNCNGVSERRNQVYALVLSVGQCGSEKPTGKTEGRT